MSVDSERPAPTRVWLADDHRIVRAGLRQMIDGAGDICVVGESSDGEATLSGLAGVACDIVLLDLSMPHGGVDLIPKLTTAFPGLHVLVLSMHGAPQLVTGAVRAGARGYITKEADAGELFEAVRRVAGGGRYMDPRLAESLLFERIDDQERPLDILTSRERQVLERLAEGQSLREIADEFGRSAKTVSVQKSSLMRKLRLATNADLFGYAMRHGLGRARRQTS